MANIICVRFRQAGKIYFFSPGDIDVSQGDKVIVETTRGVECGKVVDGPKHLEDSLLPAQLKQILRKANYKDEKQIENNSLKEKEAMRICREKVSNHGLEMKLIEAEYTFDNSKLLFYFTADGRVDFRELVKDLAGVFRTRIELRQIGVRDETKIMGGIGACGLVLCCHKHLTDFAPFP